MALSSTHTHTLAIDSSLQVLWLPHELRSIFAARSEFCLQQELLFPHMNNSSKKNISSLPAPNAVSLSLPLPRPRLEVAQQMQRHLKRRAAIKSCAPHRGQGQGQGPASSAQHPVPSSARFWVWAERLMLT